MTCQERPGSSRSDDVVENGAFRRIPLLARLSRRKVKSSVRRKCSGEVRDGLSDLPNTYPNYPEQLGAWLRLHIFQVGFDTSVPGVACQSGVYGEFKYKYSSEA